MARATAAGSHHPKTADRDGMEGMCQRSCRWQFLKCECRDSRRKSRLAAGTGAAIIVGRAARVADDGQPLDAIVVASRFPTGDADFRLALRSVVIAIGRPAGNVYARFALGYIIIRASLAGPAIK